MYVAKSCEWYIITACKVADNNITTVALYEDSGTGGYINWTDDLLKGKRFNNLEEAKKYQNCSFDFSVKKYTDENGSYEITGPFKVQRAEEEIVLFDEWILDYKGGN